jgi:hypothetical protein
MVSISFWTASLVSALVTILTLGSVIRLCHLSNKIYDEEVFMGLVLTLSKGIIYSFSLRLPVVQLRVKLVN